MLEVTAAGLYCPVGDFYIDPLKPVRRALLTHGHANHAKEGSEELWAHPATLAVIGHRWRKAPKRVHPMQYGEEVSFPAGLRLSLHAAGHILGSAQILLQWQGERWLVTGDFKRQADPSCPAFEVVACDVLITEATFALPVFVWPETRQVVQQIREWADQKIQEHGTAVLYAYSLGKAQRLLSELAAAGQQRLALHSSADALCKVYRDFGFDLPDYQIVDARSDAKAFEGCLMILPPMMQRSRFLQTLKAPEAFVSGWMRVRGMRRRRAVNQGFVLSDHADWPALIDTVQRSQASQVYVTHGYADILARYLRESLALQAEPLTVLRRGEEDEPL